jgi:hypothetical protein
MLFAFGDVDVADVAKLLFSMCLQPRSRALLIWSWLRTWMDGDFCDVL